MNQINMNSLSVKSLLRIQADILSELKNREIVRGNNAPIGDLSELLVLKSRGGKLESNSTKSHDITDPSGKKIQVKARSLKAHSGKFSAFRSFDFDTAIFFVFNPDTAELVWAREVSAEDIDSKSYYQKHTNSKTITASQVLSLGVDVTEEFINIYETL